MTEIWVKTAPSVRRNFSFLDHKARRNRLPGLSVQFVSCLAHYRWERLSMKCCSYSPRPPVSTAPVTFLVKRIRILYGNSAWDYYFIIRPCPFSYRNCTHCDRLIFSSSHLLTNRICHHESKSCVYFSASCGIGLISYDISSNTDVFLLRCHIHLQSGFQHKQ